MTRHPAGGDPDEPQPSIQHRRIRSGEDFDIIIGFLGFWAVVLFLVTVWMELTAQPALGWALGLLAILLAMFGMIKLRRRLPARTATRPN